MLFFPSLHIAMYVTVFGMFVCLLYQRTRDLFIPCAYFRWAFVGSCHCVVFFSSHPILILLIFMCVRLIHSFTFALWICECVPVFFWCCFCCSCDVSDTSVYLFPWWTSNFVFSLFLWCWYFQNDPSVRCVYCINWTMCSSLFFSFFFPRPDSFYFPFRKISYMRYIHVCMDRRILYIVFLCNARPFLCIMNMCVSLSVCVSMYEWVTASWREKNSSIYSLSTPLFTLNSFVCCSVCTFACFCSCCWNYCYCCCCFCSCWFIIVTGKRAVQTVI